MELPGDEMSRSRGLWGRKKNDESGVVSRGRAVRRFEIVYRFSPRAGGRRRWRVWREPLYKGTVSVLQVQNAELSSPSEYWNIHQQRFHNTSLRYVLSLTGEKRAHHERSGESQTRIIVRVRAHLRRTMESERIGHRRGVTLHGAPLILDLYDQPIRDFLSFIFFHFSTKTFFGSFVLFLIFIFVHVYSFVIIFFIYIRVCLFRCLFHCLFVFECFVV